MDSIIKSVKLDLLGPGTSVTFNLNNKLNEIYALIATFFSGKIKISTKIDSAVKGVSMKERTLTKSRFKMASECPSKLFYTGKKEYGNNNLDNSFLEALAGGGFQVGELAKFYFPGGQTVETLDSQMAIHETQELMKAENAVIFEAAFRFEDFLVRADVIRKKGNTIDLFEVKAKSYDGGAGDTFYKKRGGLSAEWLPYLKDVAFQKFVIQNAIPGTTVFAYLVLANKAAKCSVEGLNQMFLLKKDESGRKKAFPKPGLTPESICREVLVTVPVDNEILTIWNGEESGPKNSKREKEELPFAEMARFFAKSYREDLFIPSDVAEAPCKTCEYRISSELKSQGLKSGFDECWNMNLSRRGLKNADLSQAKVIDLWNFRGSKKLLAEGKFFLKDVTEEDIGVKESDKCELSPSERQWIQVQKNFEEKPTPYIETEGLRVAMNSWKFPHHFIDFETSMVALPFNKGRRPYEQIAFQFSHHILHENGRIEHAGEYINNTRGAFPNYDFLRELKKQLETDNGAIFRYASHENTVLCQIYDQLEAETDIADKQQLQTFIRSITKSDNERRAWIGDRNMVDLCDVWKKHAYLHATGGSNSIKKVLPAVLNEKTSSIMQFKQPIYGRNNVTTSLNFQNWTWIREEAGKVLDPYKLLPQVFEDLTEREREIIENPLVDDDLANGGSAMTAYSMMQFTEMSEAERDRVKQALLKYCELDTFAMVLVFLYFHDMVNAQRESKSVA